MKFESIVIISSTTGVRVRLSVGRPYKNFEVLQIRKKVYPKELPLEVAKEAFGTYSILFKGPDGLRYRIANNQSPAPVINCTRLDDNKIVSIPALLSQLAYDTNQAEFHHPLQNT